MGTQLTHGKGHSTPHTLFGPLCSGTVAHLSNCRALVILFRVDSSVLTRLSYDSVVSATAVIVLNAAAKLDNNSRKYDRISPLLRDLHWPRIPEHIKFRPDVVVFRCHGPCGTSSLADVISALSLASFKQLVKTFQLIIG